MPYYDISQDKKQRYRIQTPGKHIFFFQNRSGRLIFDVCNEKSSVYVFGVFEGSKNTSYKLETIQNHIAPKANSKILIKSVLKDSSRFAYHGVIRIAKKAQKTNASLENRNLLLSPKASSQSKPALEILADDVQCSHAATTAPVSREQSDYLMLRGLSKQKSQKLLAQGFLNDVYTQRDRLRK